MRSALRQPNLIATVRNGRCDEQVARQLYALGPGAVTCVLLVASPNCGLRG